MVMFHEVVLGTIGVLGIPNVLAGITVLGVLMPERRSVGRDRALDPAAAPIGPFGKAGVALVAARLLLVILKVEVAGRGFEPRYQRVDREADIRLVEVRSDADELRQAAL